MANLQNTIKNIQPITHTARISNDHANFKNPIENILLRRPLVEQATGISRTTIYRRIQEGLFTKPIEIGGKRSAWLKTEIEAINAARIAGKSDTEVKELVIQLHSLRLADQSGANQ